MFYTKGNIGIILFIAEFSSTGPLERALGWLTADLWTITTVNEVGVLHHLAFGRHGSGTTEKKQRRKNGFGPTFNGPVGL